MENQQVNAGRGQQHHTETGPIVTVTVDNETKDVQRGSYGVTEFKALVGVDAALELAQVVAERSYLPQRDHALGEVLQA